MRRRAFLAGTAATLAAGRAAAQAPAGSTWLDGARAEGRVAWYAALDLAVAEKVVGAFQATYPGITVQLQRSGAERNFAKLAQEQASGLAIADVIDSSDAAHFIVWKRQGWLASFLPDAAPRHFRPEHLDPDGTWGAWRATLCPMGINTKLVAADEAPRAFADLLDPRWAGKIVKAHPGYSGTIMTATFQMVRELGWPWLEKLSRQRVMQVQSAVDPPKKLAAGERPVMADGSEAALLYQRDGGQPVAPVYPAEGTPFVTSGAAVMRNAPHPNAARLFQSFLFSLEGQQLIVDVSGFRALHGQVREKPGRTPLAEIRVMQEDAAGVEAAAEEIKKRYTQLFRV